MEADSVSSLLLDGGTSSFNPFEIPDQMDLFDLTDLYMSNDLPDFITSQEVPSSQDFTPESSPLSSPPSISMGVPDIKNEPLSPGQVSDGGSSSDEACYIDFAKMAPVKSELLPTFVNPASLDVKFCNERLVSPESPLSAAQRAAAPRRSLKRRRETTIKPTISPDQLFPSLDTQKQLSPEEERELKKQKRLIKNRESAQKSRQRRKAYIEELESKVNVLTNQSEQLAQENKVLKEDLAYLLNVLKKTPGVPSEVLSKTASLGVAPSTPIRGVKAAGVCLLIVLFSFGLFFNAKNGPTGPTLPFDPNTPREPIPEVLPTSHYDKKYTTRMLKSLKDAEYDERRDLLEIFPERTRGRRLITIKEEKPSVTVEQSPSLVTHLHNPDRKIKQERTDERPAPRETPCIKKQKKSGNWTKTPVMMETVEEEGTLVTRGVAFAQESQQPRTTSYFFCSDAREVIMEDVDPSQPQQPRTVSLLVPLEAFNGTAAGEGPLFQHLQNHDPAAPPALVEVSCQVLNMNVYTSAANNTVSVS